MARYHKRAQDVQKHQSELLKRDFEHLFCSLNRPVGHISVSGPIPPLLPWCWVFQEVIVTAHLALISLGYPQCLLHHQFHSVMGTQLTNQIQMNLEQNFFLQTSPMPFSILVLSLQQVKSVQLNPFGLTSLATTDITWVLALIDPH